MTRANPLLLTNADTADLYQRTAQLLLKRMKSIASKEAKPSIGVPNYEF